MQFRVSCPDELIHLQREIKIGIKSADKGGGVVILKLNDYMKVCYNHLLAVNEFALENAKKQNTGDPKRSS